MTKTTLLISLFTMSLAIISLLYPDTPKATYNWSQTLDAIRYVETGSHRNGGIGAVGDNGNALGPYQIWEVYWQDAKIEDRHYEEVLNDKKLSERVIYNYMMRYQAKAAIKLQLGSAKIEDVELVSRTHNGGPRGHLKKCTLPYYRKIVTALRRDDVTMGQ